QVLSSSETARVSDVVNAAGLTSAAFYRAFASKDELVIAILRDGANRLADYLEHQMAKAADPSEQITQRILGGPDQARNRRVAGQTRAIVQHANRLPLDLSAPGGPADSLRRPLHVPLQALARPDVERDAIAIVEGVMALLFRHLQQDRPVEQA